MTEGVSPSVEVKRIDIPEVLASDDNDGEPNAQRTPGNEQQAQPPAIAAPPKPAEDLMLKKAIEVVTANSQVKKKAA